MGAFCAPESIRAGYTYPRGEQKRLEQTKRRDRRLSIIAPTNNQFCLWFVIGGVDRKSYIQCPEEGDLINGSIQNLWSK